MKKIAWTSKIFAYRKKMKCYANASTAFAMTIHIWKSSRAKSSTWCGQVKSFTVFPIPATDPPPKNQGQALTRSSATQPVKSQNDDVQRAVQVRHSAKRDSLG